MADRAVHRRSIRRRHRQGAPPIYRYLAAKSRYRDNLSTREPLKATRARAKGMTALPAAASQGNLAGEAAKAMSRYLNYFRPGEEARMLARCQFGLFVNGACGATLTYPIKGMPWRRNIRKQFELALAADVTELLFSEVSRIRHEFPRDCLSIEEMWSDFSEKANPIARERQSGRLCHRIAIFGVDGQIDEDYSLREDSEALLSSALHKIISELIEPYEKL